MDKTGKTGTFHENVYIKGSERQIRLKTDRTIYAPGQAITAKILSSGDATVFVDVAKNSSVIWSKQISVRNGSESFVISYRPDFKGELSINAYFFDDDGEIEESTISVQSVIYPTPSDLSLNLKNAKAVYRPGEDARLSFNVKTGSGLGAESALGIVVLDKAIEERARVEQLPDNMTDLRKLLGTAEAFGDLTRRDLEKIDTTKPISADLQLAAEYLLANRSYRPHSFSSNSYEHDFSRVYQPRMRQRVDPLLDALRKRYAETGEYPNNALSVTFWYNRRKIGEIPNQQVVATFFATGCGARGCD